MSEKTNPTPWKLGQSYDGDVDGRGPVYTEIIASKTVAHVFSKDDANRILHAVNAHSALVAACKAALKHVGELREAFASGALRECSHAPDGWRSNRNVDVECELRAALKQAGEHDHA